MLFLLYAQVKTSERYSMKYLFISLCSVDPQFNRIMDSFVPCGDPISINRKVQQYNFTISRVRSLNGQAPRERFEVSLDSLRTVRLQSHSAANA